tara:strand:+ start:287 stop:484 length:198 start_codon:yes stop_codon:yes gene_type:complete
MAITYKLRKRRPEDSPEGTGKTELFGILKTEDGKESSIPLDEANLDYQEYLKWVEEGNEADPADE